jgi:hypothetical protein
VTVIDMLEAIPPSEILPLFFKIDTHFNLDGHERFARILRSHPPLSGLASSVQLDTQAGHLYRRRPELELPQSTP